MTDYLHALPSGYRIEEYELVRVLGSGGFGITYLGYDHHLDKAVAIKEYLPNDLAVRGDNQSVLPKSTQDQADYEWGLERFLSEAQTLARFDHRHIIKVYRFFRAHGTGYIVMEYAEGETLSELLQRKGTLTEAELKQILFPILDGLEVVHGADFLHRDIKPKNIVIREDGSPVLIDFGSARQSVVGKSRTVTAIVTPGYAPVEQYSSKGHQGAWTDIYALGAVCYRCLTGEAPDDATERLWEDPLIPATRRCKGKASKAFLEAIDRALRVDEEERPQSIKEWWEALSGEAEASAYRARKVSAKPTARSPLSPVEGNREGRLPKLLLAGVVVALVGSVAYWWLAETRQARAAREAAGEMVSIPGGTFRMGDLSGEGLDDEKPVHSVTVPAFRLGKYEVTVGQFRLFVETTGYRTDAERNADVEVFERWIESMPDSYRTNLERLTEREAGCFIYIGDDMGWKPGRSWRNPGYPIDDNQPVVCVSWNDVQAFIAWLTAQTGESYRLPSEAEWEYAARAVSTTKYHFGNDESQLCRYANHADNNPDFDWLIESCSDFFQDYSAARTAHMRLIDVYNGDLSLDLFQFQDVPGMCFNWPNESCSDGVGERPAMVGQYEPNAYGLYDMYGNVDEWVQDCWNGSYEGAPADGSTWVSGYCGEHMIRGGSWYTNAWHLRSATRDSDPRASRNNETGFRLAQDK